VSRTHFCGHGVKNFCDQILNAGRRISETFPAEMRLIPIHCRYTSECVHWTGTNRNNICISNPRCRPPGRHKSISNWFRYIWFLSYVLLHN